VLTSPHRGEVKKGQNGCVERPRGHGMDQGIETVPLATADPRPIKAARMTVGARRPSGTVQPGFAEMALPDMRRGLRVSSRRDEVRKLS
jgi:hypothetical protein